LAPDLTHFPPHRSCDCHVHVIGAKDKFPLAPQRSYTPMPAAPDALRTMLARLGLERVVLVQPSFYGVDNSCMLAAMAELDGARGVAVLPALVAADELRRLHAQGIRGLRVNIATSGPAALDTIRAKLAAAAALCQQHGWHVQTFIPADAIEALAPTFLALPVPLVIDHFGLIAPGAGGGALAALKRLLGSGRIWVKISGAYRIADDPADRRIDPLARRLCDANPERIVWGSDWPHTPKHDLRRPDKDEELPFQPIDTRGLIDLLPRWLEDGALIEKVLVHNPARLYGFAP
jgi:predicted TIM-barrel fold metal-dependent hydrolase